jgi:hypothetical protein
MQLRKAADDCSKSDTYRMSFGPEVDTLSAAMFGLSLPHFSPGLGRSHRDAALQRTWYDAGGNHPYEGARGEVG